MLTIIYNSSSRGFNTLFWLPRAIVMQCANKTLMYIKINLNLINPVLREKTKRSKQAQRPSHEKVIYLCWCHGAMDDSSGSLRMVVSLCACTTLLNEGSKSQNKKEGGRERKSQREGGRVGAEAPTRLQSKTPGWRISGNDSPQQKEVRTG